MVQLWEDAEERTRGGRAGGRLGGDGESNGGDAGGEEGAGSGKGEVRGRVVRLRVVAMSANEVEAGGKGREVVADGEARVEGGQRLRQSRM